MSDNSKIEWCSASWNPIRGTVGRHTCARISPGCDNCYAATMTRRGLGGTAPIDYGRGEVLNDPARLDETALLQPLRWKKPRRIFLCSTTDLAGSWVPDAWLDAIWAVMALAPHHTYIVLTKRPSRLSGWFHSNPYERVIRYANAELRSRWPKLGDIPIDNPVKFPYRHVWIGVSVELDRFAWRANTLRTIPAAVRWISAEPLLGSLPSLDLTGISWLVAGGESGHGARPMHPDWARDLRDRCQTAGVAYFFKQWGAWASDRPKEWGVSPCRPGRLHTFKPDSTLYSGRGYDWNDPGMTTMYRVGNHRSGRLLDGRTWDEFPEPRAAAVAGGAPA